MQPEVVAFFAALIFAIYKVVELAFIWDNQDKEEE